jgi:DhnA family fructose-bisphosphate aldolase class Ia
LLFKKPEPPLGAFILWAYPHSGAGIVKLSQPTFNAATRSQMPRSHDALDPDEMETLRHVVHFAGQCLVLILGGCKLTKRASRCTQDAVGLIFGRNL